MGIMFALSYVSALQQNVTNQCNGPTCIEFFSPAALRTCTDPTEAANAKRQTDRQMKILANFHMYTFYFASKG